MINKINYNGLPLYADAQFLWKYLRASNIFWRSYTVLMVSLSVLIQRSIYLVALQMSDIIDWFSEKILVVLRT